MTTKLRRSAGFGEMNYSRVEMDKRFPALRVALTTCCNLRCEYCPPKGENFINTKNDLSAKKLLSILNVFYEIGFRHFGFTGGEPLLRNDLHLILRECSKFQDSFLKLYTNGILLKERIEILRNLNLIKLSLDSIERNKYRKITGKEKLKSVLEGLESAIENKIKIRINAVLTQKNFDGMLNLIDFCCSKKIDLKILDLNCFDTPGHSIWRRLYKSPSEIAGLLERNGLTKRIIYTTGNYGIPMPEFRWNGTSIRIKDTKESSVYSPACKSCRYFLCQEGLYHLTLTSDGKLKMCRHRPDIYTDLSQKTDSEIKKRNPKIFK